MSLEKIINGIKKAACIGLTTIALMGGMAREAKAQENLRYEVTEIEVPGPIIGINNQGMYLVEGGRHQDFIFLDGVIRKIEGDSNDSFWNAGKINDFGEALVEKYDYSTRPHLTTSGIWKLGKIIELGFQGKDISNTEVVGFNLVAYGGRVGEPGAYREYMAYRYLLESDQTIELGDFEACLVNDTGKIAGYFYDPNSDYYRPSAVILENGVLKKLEEMCYNTAEGPVCFRINLSDMNNKGKTAGTSYWYDLWDELMFSCMWDENGRITQLDTAPFSSANAINDNNQVVGTSTIEFVGQDGRSFYVLVATLYQNGQKINLNECVPGGSKLDFFTWYLFKGLHINNRGQVICSGRGGKSYPTYYLLTPKPALSPDLNEDGIVNLRDLSELAEHWLEER
jgi:hypothetical protein